MGWSDFCVCQNFSVDPEYSVDVSKVTLKVTCVHPALRITRSWFILQIGCLCLYLRSTLVIILRIWVLSHNYVVWKHVET